MTNPEAVRLKVPGEGVLVCQHQRPLRIQARRGGDGAIVVEGLSCLICGPVRWRYDRRRKRLLAWTGEPS